MAVVSKVSTIKFSNSVGGDPAGFASWVSSVTNQDYLEGSLVMISSQFSSGGTAPPSGADSWTLSLKDDSGTIIKSFTPNPAITTVQSFSFYITSDGNNGSSIRHDTVEIFQQVIKTTGGLTATYNASSNGSTATPPTGFTISQSDRGWFRGSTNVTQTISNVSLGGAKISPAEFREVLYVKTLMGSAGYISRTVPITLSNGPANQNITGVGPEYDASSQQVNNTYPVGVTNTVTGIGTIPNATLTGLPAFIIASLVTDNINVDPRLTCVHHLQINNNSFSSPPLSDPNSADSSGQRVFPAIGYISTNLRRARGTLTGTSITDGFNGLDLHFSFVASQTGTDVPGDFTTANEGGENGWHPLYNWTDSTPGNHVKTVILKATVTDLTSSYLVNPSITYNLIAVDPNIILVAGSGRQNGLRHVVVGQDNLFIFGQLRHQVQHVSISPDPSPTPTTRVFRYNYILSKIEGLDNNYNWQDNGAGVPSSVSLIDGTFSMPQTYGNNREVRFQQVVGGTGNPPSGFSFNVSYFTINQTPTSFQLSATLNGPAIIPANTGSAYYIVGRGFPINLLSNSDPTVFTLSIPTTGSGMAKWIADADLYVNTTLYYQGSPYSDVIPYNLTGSANSHDGYKIDPILLALNGRLGTR